MDPLLTSNGRPYGPYRYEKIVEECYVISKKTNTSYTDVLKMTPLEREYLLKFIRRDVERENELIEQRRRNTPK